MRTFTSGHIVFGIIIIEVLSALYIDVAIKHIVAAQVQSQVIKFHGCCSIFHIDGAVEVHTIDLCVIKHQFGGSAHFQGFELGNAGHFGIFGDCGRVGVGVGVIGHHQD